MNDILMELEWNKYWENHRYDGITGSADRGSFISGWLAARRIMSDLESTKEICSLERG